MSASRHRSRDQRLTAGRTVVLSRTLQTAGSTYGTAATADRASASGLLDELGEPRLDRGRQRDHRELGGPHGSRGPTNSLNLVALPGTS